MWILGTNLIFVFPREFYSSFRVPSYFDYRDTTLFQLLDFLIHNFYWFFHKIEFVIEPKLFHWNDERFEGNEKEKKGGEGRSKEGRKDGAMNSPRSNEESRKDGAMNSPKSNEEVIKKSKQDRNER
ncbi:hypothetical protein Tco_1362361 [Tanacetum coccineum]